MRRTLMLVLALLVVAHPVSAQQRFSVSAGLSWLGRYPVGTTTASLRRNETGTTSPSRFTLFAADTAIERAFGINARFGVALSGAFEVEAAGSFGEPRLTASVAQDAEGDPVVLSDQRLAQLTLDGSLIWRLPWLRTVRLSPYALGGVGYLRQIDDDRTQVEIGTTGHVGGGLRYWLRGDGVSGRAIGLRAEARLQMRWGGFELAEKIRTSPAVYLLATFGL